MIEYEIQDNYSMIQYDVFKKICGDIQEYIKSKKIVIFKTVKGEKKCSV